MKSSSVLLLYSFPALICALNLFLKCKNQKNYRYIFFFFFSGLSLKMFLKVITECTCLILLIISCRHLVDGNPSPHAATP